MFSSTTVIVPQSGSNICMTTGPTGKKNNSLHQGEMIEKTINKKFRCIITMRHASHSLLSPDKFLTYWAAFSSGVKSSEGVSWWSVNTAFTRQSSAETWTLIGFGRMRVLCGRTEEQSENKQDRWTWGEVGVDGYTGAEEKEQVTWHRWRGVHGLSNSALCL